MWNNKNEASYGDINDAEVFFIFGKLVQNGKVVGIRFKSRDRIFDVTTTDLYSSGTTKQLNLASMSLIDVEECRDKDGYTDRAIETGEVLFVRDSKLILLLLSKLI